MRAWEELSALERAEIAGRLPLGLQNQLSFPQIGKIWDALRSWVLDKDPIKEKAA